MADASTSFFTFDPPLVLADMQNAVDDYIADASDAIETALLAECNPSGDAALAKEISEGTDALNSQLVDKFGEKFGVLVEYVKRNIFAVDEEIAVAAAEEANASAAAAAGGGGDGDVAPVTEEDEKETNKQLKDVKLRLAKARQEEVTLKSRQRQIEALEKLFETHREEIEQIKSAFGSGAKAKAKFAQLTGAAEKLKNIQKETIQVQAELDKINASASGGRRRR
eukprot:INCI1802.1.p1 GENE.INCI1802.1~~INCI1802.1.p1  ORF type:complete len:225 (-),score=72.29 INCI1802.1:1219-1893(-)